MTRPSLLDLYCGVGGAAMGYHRSGFDVYGVDIRPQPQYPFPFRQGDALEFLGVNGHRFHAIHASPPCQAYSATKSTTRGRGHPALIEPTREMLVSVGRPWVIENVPGAPLHRPITLCGTEFGLTATDVDGTPLVLKRHRLFESSVQLRGAGGCQCREYAANYVVAGVYGGGTSRRAESAPGKRGGYTPAVAARRALMDMPWAPIGALSQAIPPAYTLHIGRQLRQAL